VRHGKGTLGQGILVAITEGVAEISEVLDVTDTLPA